MPPVHGAQAHLFFKLFFGWCTCSAVIWNQSAVSGRQYVNIHALHEHLYALSQATVHAKSTDAGALTPASVDLAPTLPWAESESGRQHVNLHALHEDLYALNLGGSACKIH